MEFANDIIDDFFVMPEMENLPDLAEAERELFHEAESVDLHETRNALTESIDEVEFLSYLLYN